MSYCIQGLKYCNHFYRHTIIVIDTIHFKTNKNTERESSCSDELLYANSSVFLFTVMFLIAQGMFTFHETERTAFFQKLEDAGIACLFFVCLFFGGGGVVWLLLLLFCHRSRNHVQY